jgi:hypothetical protein
VVGPPVAAAGRAGQPRGVDPDRGDAARERHIGLQALAPLAWAWTDPLLSSVLGPDGDVAAIVTVLQPSGWQPFDPARPADLPQVPGIDYTRDLAALTTARPAPTP